MRAYFDSGFLFKLYWQEANTPAAQAILRQYKPPLLLSRFNEVEMLQQARLHDLVADWFRGCDQPPFPGGEDDADWRAG